MKAHLFDTIDELNKFLEGKKKVDVKYHFQVIGSKKDMSGQEQYVIADRFLALSE